MDKVLRSGLAAIFFSLILSLMSVTEAPAQNILGEILRRLDAHNKALQSLKAQVTMEKFNPQLGTKDVSVGSTQYLPKQKLTKGVMYVRIDWIKPVQEQMSMIGGDYELYRPRIGQVIYGKVEKSKGSPAIGGALSFMNMSKDQLKANYDVVYVGEAQVSDGTKTWHLQLTPKARTSYKLAELWVDGDGMPRQAKITEHNDDTTTVLLSGIRKNESIDKKLFKLDYPSSVKKIQA